MDWVPLVGGGADLSQQVAFLGGKTVRLTTKERDLLAYLARHPGRTITRRELLVEVWGNSPRGSEEPVYSTVKRLRAKIDRGDHRHVVGVHGDGYRWEPGGAAPLPRQAEGRAKQPASAFVGRDRELDAARAALDAASTVVTLVGPGGAGKTRCALELAANRAHVFCDLCVATDESGVVAAVASTLGVPLDGPTPSDWIRGIGRALATMPGRLLILDNAEHVIAVVASMVSAWRSANPVVLVTSREPLGVEGERVVEVGPLPVEDAMRLLEERMTALDGQGSGADHRAIVQRVDCLPLAIELAAAQARALGAKALLASLDAQLATLTAGRRDAPARHWTLRAAVEWSWTFLDERERAALGDLTVFANAFCATAACAVIGHSEAMSLVTALRNKSQLQRAGDRLLLYAAVRELAIERTGSRADARARHAAHFVASGEAAVALLEGPEHREGSERLSNELGDIHAAFDWARATTPDLAARLALVLDRALALQASRAPTRLAILELATEHVEDADLRCRLLVAQGRIEGSPKSTLDEALALARGGDHEVHALLARAERLCATDPATARADLERALSLSASKGRSTLRGRALALLGEIAWASGIVGEASARLQEALAIHVATTDRRALARTSALLAHVDRLDTGGGKARALLALAERAAVELGDPVVEARVLLDLGQHLTRIGDQQAAALALESAARSYERLGFARERAFVHLHVAETLVGIGDHDRALAEALAAWTALPDGAGRSTVHEAIGCIHLLRDDRTEARRWFEEGLAIARASGASRSECTLLGKRGLLSLARGAFRDALADFDEATVKNEARGSVAVAGASLTDRAMAHFALGNEEAARRDVDRARELLCDPPIEQIQGRMLAACEIVGRAFAAIRAGRPPATVHDETRASVADFFRRPAHEWDVVLRLFDWLVGSLVTCPRSEQTT